MSTFHIQKTSTTYQDEFGQPSTFSPPLLFYQEPCLYQHEDELNPRCFPISMPIFPKRPRDGKIPIAAGFETYVDRLNAGNLKDEWNDGSTSSSARQTPVEEIYNDLPHVLIEDLVKIGTYTPSSHLQIFTPTETKKIQPQLMENFKTNETSVRYKPRVYRDKPEKWQKIGCIWDKVQERKGISKVNENITNRLSKDATPRLLLRPRMHHGAIEATTKRYSTTSGKHYFRDNIPGYGGYQPRLPRANKDSLSNEYQATSRIYYRRHPSISYRLPLYGHRGPLSRTVTLTQPCNPFNKISKNRITVS